MPALPRLIRPAAAVAATALICAAATACSSSPPAAPTSPSATITPAAPQPALSGGVTGDQAAPGACPYIDAAQVAAVLHENVTGSDANAATSGPNCSFVLQTGTVVTIAVFPHSPTGGPAVATTAPAGNPVTVNGGHGYWNPPATLTVLTNSGDLVVVGVISLANFAGTDQQPQVVALYNALHNI